MTTLTLDDLLARQSTRRRLPDPHVRRIIREAAGVSQAELAQVLGVARVTVTRWEDGTRSPRGRVLEAYVAALERLREAS